MKYETFNKGNLRVLLIKKSEFPDFCGNRQEIFTSYTGFGLEEEQRIGPMILFGNPEEVSKLILKSCCAHPMIYLGIRIKLFSLFFSIESEIQKASLN